MIKAPLTLVQTLFSNDLKSARLGEYNNIRQRFSWAAGNACTGMPFLKTSVGLSLSTARFPGDASRGPCIGAIGSLHYH